jgi:hypothetical protein
VNVLPSIFLIDAEGVIRCRPEDNLLHPRTLERAVDSLVEELERQRARSSS